MRSSIPAVTCCLALLLLLLSASCKNRGSLHAVEPIPFPSPTLRTGNWGGDHAGMTVTDGGTTLEFDCAHGSIDGPVPLDDTGGFDVDGLYYQEHGGPFIDPDPLVPVKVNYSGQVNGDQMVLIVRDPTTGWKIGAFTLTYGATPHIFKCV